MSDYGELYAQGDYDWWRRVHALRQARKKPGSREAGLRAEEAEEAKEFEALAQWMQDNLDAALVALAESLCTVEAIVLTPDAAAVLRRAMVALERYASPGSLNPGIPVAASQYWGPTGPARVRLADRGEVSCIEYGVGVLAGVMRLWPGGFKPGTPIPTYQRHPETEVRCNLTRGDR